MQAQDLMIYLEEKRERGERNHCVVTASVGRGIIDGPILDMI